MLLLSSREKINVFRVSSCHTGRVKFRDRHGHEILLSVDPVTVNTFIQFHTSHLLLGLSMEQGFSLLPANEVWVKVIFLYLFVSYSVHGSWGGVHGRGRVLQGYKLMHTT